jgi:HSP20 family protein
MTESKKKGIETTFRRMRDSMQQLVDEIISQTPPYMTIRKHYWSPSVDVYETERRVVVLAELAGVQAEHVKVTLDGQLLRISGHRPEIPLPPKRRLHQMEISHGRFERLIKIPVPVDGAGSKATCSDGFLTVELLRADVAVPRKIEIEFE